MRTLKLLVVTLVLLMLPTLAWAKASKTLVANSSHDLRTAVSPGPAQSFELCNFCHVPHKLGSPVNAPASVGAYLWNKTLSTVTTYGVYSSDTFNNYHTDITDVGPLNSTSSTYTSVTNLCLSCHDGATAVLSWYVAPLCATFAPCPNPQGGTISPTAQVADLTQQHPLHFSYTTALATAANLLVPASVSSVDGKGEIPLFSSTGKMECATCHDPHNACGVSGGICLQNFPTQSTGAFCNYCHI